jgi:hypothetical protein
VIYPRGQRAKNWRREDQNRKQRYAYGGDDDVAYQMISAELPDAKMRVLEM